MTAKLSAEELSEALLVLDGDASFGSDVWRASQSIRAYIAALEAELAEARIRVAAMLEVFGGYTIPEVDAAILHMQEAGLDVWSMQRQMEIAAEARAQEREACAVWHDERARNTPDAFEMEFHQISAAAIRARREG